MNQVSIVALEVPVLPAAGRLAVRMAGAWPRVTTWRSSVEVSQAVRGGMAGFGGACRASATRRSSRSDGVPNGSPIDVWSSMTAPMRLRTRRT